MGSKKKICILDLGVGNFVSIKGRIEKLEYKVKVSDKSKIIDGSDILIIPGVGSSKFLMKKIQDKKLRLSIKKFSKNKTKKIIGFCAGMQIMSNYSEEGKVKCLSLINSKVIKIKTNKPWEIPNIGFRTIINKKKYFKDSSNFYFNHSYKMIINKKIAAKKFYINYLKQRILAMFVYKNIYGIQFHPERSGKNGLILLSKVLGK